MLFCVAADEMLKIFYLFSDQLRCNTACAELTVREQRFLQQNLFEAITQIYSNNKRPDLKSIHSFIVRIEKLKEVSVKKFEQLILQQQNEGKLLSKRF